MKIVLLGSGNTATVLGKKLKHAGHEILQVFGRNQLTAGMLANDLGAKAVSELDRLSNQADVYMVAVSDAAVEALAGELRLNNTTIVHTAGSISKDVLKSVSPHYGVFYPLQSLRAQLNELPEIPIAIDASDESSLAILKQLAASISANVFFADDEHRLKLHLTAVFVNNFVNHIYALAEKYCKEEGLDFKLLLPLIAQTTKRLNDISPFEAQTGPAVRSDDVTIAKHLALLEQQPELKKLYSTFTSSIQQLHTGSTAAR